MAPRLFPSLPVAAPGQDSEDSCEDSEQEEGGGHTEHRGHGDWVSDSQEDWSLQTAQAILGH